MTTINIVSILICIYFYRIICEMSMTTLFFFLRFSDPNMWISYKKLFNGNNVNKFICKAYKSHYEALNIPKTATHKEVKDAYYKLSMIYHPDKNKGSEEAAKIFRDITSAYEVLGNVRQRRLYDSKGCTAKKTTQYYPKQPFETMDFKSHKTNVSSKNYNFDEWSKAHYTHTFQKHHSNQEMFSRKKMNEEHISQQHTYSLLSIMIFVSLFILISIFDHIKRLKRERQDIKKYFGND